MTGVGRRLVSNVVARIVALASLGAATVVVARVGGPEGVGVYALVRVLPGLVGVVAACGLPGAAAYFLAGPSRTQPRLWASLVTLLAAGSAAGTLAWLALTPLLHRLFFRDLSLLLVAWVAASVATQLPVAVGKACLQGVEDLRGADIAIAAEEAAFLPCLAVLAWAGVGGAALVVAALVAADVAVAAYAWRRLWRRGAIRGSARPDLGLVRTVAGYGTRGQVGGVLTLLNLRLDFAILGALAGPAVLGIYAVASKYAELARLPGLALTWVLYPRFARSPAEAAAATLRRLLPRGALLGAAVVVPLVVAAAWLLPLLYGRGFVGAVVPAYVLLGGLVLETCTGVATAYLYGGGRPGLNSVGAAAGVVVTVGLDVLLIPRYGAMGAAAASAAAYLATAAVVGGLALRFARPRAAQPVPSVPAEVLP